MPCHRADDPMQPPCIEALIAATVALMTCWADPAPNARANGPEQRRLLGRKIVSNLFFLHHHPELGSGLRQVLGNAHARWAAVAHAEGDADALACRPAAGMHVVLH